MKLAELVSNNGHKLVKYNETIYGRIYVPVFNYSVKFGGTIDGHKYYNDYYVEVEELKE